ncbi:bacteriocin [Actinomycetota bacterium]|nr:bacteriocin [Actinomycetota bacterium]
MVINKVYTAVLALMFFMGAFLFPQVAYGAAADTTPPELSASLSGDALTIEAKDDTSGIAAVYIDGHRVNALSGGKAAVNLKDYAGGAAKVSIYAVDGAGNNSNTVTLENPYYRAPVALSPQTPAQQTSSSNSGSSASAGSTSPGAATAPAANPQTQTETQTTESAIPNEGGAFTPGGAGTVLDHATDTDGKEFYTIASASGAVYYLIIDKQRTDGGAYFLNAVTEADLLALAEDADAGGIGTAIQKEEPAPEPEQTPEPTPAPEPEKDSGMGAGTVIFLIIAAAIAGGAAYYIKVLRPKRRTEAEMTDDELWDEDFEPADDEFGADDYLPEEADDDEGDMPLVSTDEDTAEVY